MDHTNHAEFHRHELQPFKKTESEDITINVDVKRSGLVIELRYLVQGLSNGIVWPPVKTEGQRREGIYYSTCCEAFFAFGEYYVEYNFAPNKDWCGFAFAGYRHAIPMSDNLFRPKSFDVAVNTKTATLECQIDLSATLGQLVPDLQKQPLKMSATAILNIASENSYWALVHNDTKPDFHRLDSFQIKI